MVGKFAIVDSDFKDYMKDENGNVNIYETLRDAQITCGMYEFEDALIVQIVDTYKDDEHR